MNRFRLTQTASPAFALSVALLATLAACGGGSGTETSATVGSLADTAPAPATTATATLDSATAAAVASNEVLPAYHMAPALLDEPGQDDAGGTNASARQKARTFNVDGAAADIDTARLSVDTLKLRMADSAKARVASAGAENANPLATAIVGAVHTPAQIRAAYGLAALPVAGATLTTAQAAALGAGQTIYLVDAYHDASALSDLNAFSAKFGLPTCTNVAVASTAALPLATPPSACTFSSVYSTTTVAMTTVAPAYNATWAPESKLDVQWAHAIAPLARLVLIEMPNSLSTSILGANLLAAKMGKGVVSMSFGSAEAGWSSSVDSYFAGAGMTYVAAAGDVGSQVLWPAVSPNVVAVGGTSLNWSGSGTRYEAAWVKGGGGMSAYVALPSWQSGVTPVGGTALARRAVPDVAFNADPLTGQYVALTLPGAATVWSAYGGTSIAAPQWAGVIAVANAIRAVNAKPALGDIHATLYKSIATTPGTYAAALGDVVNGTNGSCATCRAGAGFDQATGWGTPSAAGLLSALTGSNVSAPMAPAFSSSGKFTGTVGTAFKAALSATNPNSGTLAYSISGAPAGLAASTTGALSWAAPVAGTYAFTAKVVDSSGYSSTQAETLVVAAAPVATTNHAPTLASATWTAKAGTTFTTTLVGKDADGDALTYTATGAPASMYLLSSGYVYWPTAVKGTYAITVTVHDSKGATGAGVITLVVS